MVIKINNSINGTLHNIQTIYSVLLGDLWLFKLARTFSNCNLRKTI